MGRKLAFWLIWIGLASYAFLLAPPNQPDTLTLIKNLSIGNIEGINPIIVSLFYVMGIWPIIYSCLLFIDGKAQKIPAWPFAVCSFGVGAFAILPYLALRETNQEFTGDKNIFLKILDSRWTGILTALATIAIASYGLLAGDWNDFIQQWQTNRFINVMSLDFCMLFLLFPTLLGDDMARREVKNPQILRLLSLIPLFGALLYLCLRPNLLESNQKVAKQPVAANTP
ncbi:MAG TPA: DUF2834 domain-containing protein [Leptolyngbyaceae cyanobacterium]